MKTPERAQADAVRAQDGFAEAFADRPVDGAAMSPRGATYAAAYFMALADGQATEDELVAIKRFVDLLAPLEDNVARDADEQLLLTMDAAAVAGDHDAFIARIARALPEHRQRVVALLVATLCLLSDGVTHQQELALVKKLASAFAIDDEALEHIFMSARGIAAGPWAR